MNSLILSGFPLTSFHLAEASLSGFSWLYDPVCAVVQKYREMPFIYNYSHFEYSFYNQPVLIAKLENVNKLWNNNYNYTTATERTKSKQKQNQVTSHSN